MNKEDRKKALHMLSYGVYILTSKSNNEISAVTVTWVSQASFEPPMLSVCIKRNSASYLVVRKRGEFILHMLSEKQKNLAASFLKPSKIKQGRINDECYELKDDLPIITSAPSYIRCSVVEILENGDHPLFLSEVINAVVQKESEPLELRNTDWQYGG